MRYTNRRLLYFTTGMQPVLYRPALFADLQLSNLNCSVHVRMTASTMHHGAMTCGLHA